MYSRNKDLIEFVTHGALHFDMLYFDQHGRPQPREFIAKMISGSHSFDRFENDYESMFEYVESLEQTVQKTKRNKNKGKWVNQRIKGYESQFDFCHEDYYVDKYSNEERESKDRAVFGKTHEEDMVKEETGSVRKTLRLNGIYCLREDKMRGYFFDFLHIVAHNNLSLREVQDVLNLSKTQLLAIKQVAASLGMVFVSHQCLIPFFNMKGVCKVKKKQLLTIASWGMLNRDCVTAYTSARLQPRCIDTIGCVAPKVKNGRDAVLSKIADATFRSRQDIEIENG